MGAMTPRMASIGSFSTTIRTIPARLRRIFGYNHHLWRTLGAPFHTRAKQASMEWRRGGEKTKSVRDVILLQSNARSYVTNETINGLLSFPFLPKIRTNLLAISIFWSPERSAWGKRFKDDAAMESFVRQWLQERLKKFYEKGFKHF